MITTLRSIDTPNKGNSAKSSERAIILRQVHPTGTGYICGITSADTGAKVGMSKQLSVCADITDAGSLEVLKDVVRNDASVISIVSILRDMIVISRHNLHKVFVNGDWLGCVENFARFLAEYRAKRRRGEINMYTTVSHSITANEIHLWVDSGRLTRPLLVVYNNMAEEDYSHDKFKQWILLTDEHVHKLRAGEIDIDDLAREGVVEYITPEEHENTYIAFEYDRFRQHINDPLHRFTHVDIPQGNMGLVALTSVFANHNQAARIVFQTNQVKQTNSSSLKNWPFAAHKDLYHQIYNEDPLVTTFAYRHIPPMGTNAIVAISIYGGYNQEDSLIVNKSSVDRGMFDCAHFTYDKCEVEQNEIVCRPDPTNTADIKSYCNYEKLVNGIVTKGTFVQDGDCLVGKVAKLQKGDMKDPNIVYTDRSMVYRKKEPAYVWKVIHAPNYDDRKIIKIVFKTFRSTEIGCKFCVPDHNEVLTDKGWKRFCYLDGTELICSLVDERIKYVKPVGIYHFEHDGEMIQIRTPELFSTTTPDQKLYAKQHGRDSFELIRAQSAISQQKLTFKKDGIKLGVDASIESILENARYDEPLPDQVWQLNQERSRELLIGLIGTPDIYFAVSDVHANDLQRLALHAGWSATIKQGHIVHLNKTRNEPVVDASQCADAIHYVGMVSCVEVPSHVFYMRENGIAHWTGNSSRAGQKGVAGFLYDEADMPANKDGIRPDLIFNPLSLITRMTAGVIFEGMMAKLAAHTGTCPEATMFKKLDTDNIAAMLESHGFARNGTERLYNGMTGMYMDAEIFMAPMMYQTLQKYTIDTVYANSISPTDVLTRQPLHGKKIAGALKIGSMETACMSVSSVNFLQKKAGPHSDGIEDYICTRCNSRAVVVNEDAKLYSCNLCGDLASLVKFSTSHTSQLFFNELQAWSVGAKFHARRPVFEVVTEESE